MSLETDLNDELMARGALYCTFIGGPVDGQIIEVDNNMSVFHVPKSTPIPYTPGGKPEFIKIESVAYYRTCNLFYFEAE